MDFLPRAALTDLQAWRDRHDHKPLIVRGARQVGKSALVRELARTSFEVLAEVNFERDAELGGLFACNDPRRIASVLEARLGRPIQPGSTLLFLDEIQAAPAVLPCLRYFYEQMPDLHVVAAGSLLEFLLGEPHFSMPVGRVEYLHLGPMVFEEYLQAIGSGGLARFLAGLAPGDDLPLAIHGPCLDAFREFLVVGGMPEAVAARARNRPWSEVEAIHHGLLATYRDDFGKYGRRAHPERLRKVFTRLPALVGQRFKYANVDRDERSTELARALDHLCLARVAHRVVHSSANGVPLGAESREQAFKVLFLDVGLQSAALGLRLDEIAGAKDVMVHAGAACEQFVGQHLLYSLPSYREPELYFWSREKANAAAEIDYVLAEARQVVPVEVKAGKTGTLKSLHYFLREKGLAFGVRLNADTPSLLDAATALPDGRNIRFRLLSLPLYLVGQVRRMVRTCG